MRGSKAALAATVAALMTIVSLGLFPAGASSHPAAVGAWLEWFAEDPAMGYPAPAPQDEASTAAIPTAVSLVVLPDGNVVYWNGLQDTENLSGPLAISAPPDQTSKSRHLDLSSYFSSGATTGIPTSAWSTPTPEDGGGGDLFCADQRLLADGTVLAVGGSSWVNEDEALTDSTALDGHGRTELYGLRSARRYDPDGNSTGGTWTQLPQMNHGRWYPAMVTLADGSLFVTGGVERLVYNSQLAPGDSPPGYLIPQNVRESEIINPYAPSPSWSAQGDSVSLPLFPRLHLLPNGNVLFTTTGQVWGPFGEDKDQLSWNQMKWFDPSTATWDDVNPTGTSAHLGTRNGVFSVMLPLEPDVNGNYTEATVLIGGGTLGTSPGSYYANSLTELITWTPSGVTRDLGPLMNNLRWFSSGVVSPTGEVVAVSGADLDEVHTPGSETAVRQAEMYDPATNTWIPLADGQRDRTYHNTAVLLKDGSILVGGHSPIVNGYGQDHSTTPGKANNFKDPTFEIFKPPYLYRGARPTITSVSATTLSRGGSFTIDTPDAGNATLRVVLSRLGSTTHVTDPDQRTVVVEHSAVDSDTVSVTVPSSGAVVPGGYYYVFLVKDNGQGPTPSVAEIVKVNV